MLPLIVSYYTLDTGYEEEIKNLINSCEKLGLQTDFVGIKSRGKWDQNCCYKPQFLMKKLQEHQRPLVWVDADAVILKKPLLLENLTCDIAVRVYEDLPVSHPSKVYTGTVYFGNTPGAFELLKLWDEISQQMLKQSKQEVWDQITLKEALLKKTDVDLFPLPDTYSTIYDKTLTPKEEAVILHYQASRLFKKVINKEVAPFWEEAMFSQESRNNFFT